MKKNTKTTKKQTKPVCVVNMDSIETLDDIAPAFALAKQKAGLALTDDELISIIECAVNNLSPRITFIYECCKYEPWYKRLWKKVKKVFKR